jgi:hypothetical protein
MTNFLQLTTNVARKKMCLGLVLPSEPLTAPQTLRLSLKKNVTKFTARHKARL